MKNISIIIWIVGLLILIFSTLAIIMFVGNNQYDDKRTETGITLEQAKSIAQQRILNDYNYNDLNGYDLRLKKDPVQCGADCFELVYEYKVDQNKISNLEKIEMSMVVEENQINNLTYSEITNPDKHLISINDFESCVKAGYEVLYPDCQGCKPYCETPKGIIFTQDYDGICTDKCGDGICDEIVCQGQGCPCPETIVSCPKDCK
jgi:hypothetical protein